MSGYEKIIKRFNSVKEELSFFFEEHPYPLLSFKEVDELTRRINVIYGLKSLKKEVIISFLLKKRFLEIINVKEYSFYKHYGVNVDSFDIANCFYRSTYFSYYSALFINGLTLQIPKTIYLSYEKTKIYPEKYNLTQNKIDKAFNKSPRISQKIIQLSQFDVKYLQSKNHNRIGLVPFRNIYWVTDLERTLIDITVRPFYAGGVVQVLNAYEEAKNKLDINKLHEYYNSMKFIYPYNQAIGFYLQKSGYSKEQYEIFKKTTNTFKFYLTYNILSKDYSDEWNLYFPKGL
jgi:predicted transcriptional regulator of viral defense system